jgi:hypothetical protein
VRQSESAALHKASKAASSTFLRHVAGVYTAASMLSSADDPAYCDLLASSNSVDKAEDDDEADAADMDDDADTTEISDLRSSVRTDSGIAIIQQCLLKSWMYSFTIVSVSIDSHTFSFQSCEDGTIDGSEQQLMDILDSLQVGDS